ncbi:PilZ domain-containing protein [Tepidibacillus infernus]|uniref:PilZ domain-containing protein n=1 Tax=Tepidibacillus decaturensis TaxID=1413211 RepID=A0A135L496_9BACI|nr:PilZ domain-containing protein [Tepidibacillus decaturensis]KXG43828.1 hypothetical protein U473_07255 [Tepidibacillus decaturensis]
MIGNQIVIQGASFKRPGVIRYVESDFLEIQTSVVQLNVGDKISCTLNEDGIIESFETTVMGKTENSLITLVPLILRDKWIISRENPRIRIDAKGKITAVSFSGSKPLIDLNQLCQIELHDVSEGGIGFSTKCYIRENGIALLSFRLFDQFLHLEVEIMKSTFSKKDKKFYYGAKFIDTNSKDYQVIRSFIIETLFKRYMLKKGKK